MTLGGTVRVLICDDEPDVQLLLRLTVQSLGHEAITVGRPSEALAACRSAVPDVLLLDVSMPEMDGPELLRRLRSLGVEPKHTMLVSAITPGQLRELAIELGIGWLSKPFTTEHVRDALIAA